MELSKCIWHEISNYMKANMFSFSEITIIAMKVELKFTYQSGFFTRKHGTNKTDKLFLERWSAFLLNIFYLHVIVLTNISLE